MHYTYSDAFAHTMTSLYGAQGAEWLERLPHIIQRCIERWSLTELRPCSHLTYNYVLFGMMKAVPVVLKLRCSVAELENEVAALKAFEDHGGVKVLGYDSDLGAILIARVVPGDSLAALVAHHDEKATGIAMELMRSLHSAPVVEGFSSLEQILPDLSKDHAELMPFIARARALRIELLATQQQRVLLHGDFHHGNILLEGNNRWIAIDPAGIIGDPLYDLAVYIRNPIQKLVSMSHASELITNRIEHFARMLGHDAQRIYEWVYLQTACSTYWSLEDGIAVGNHIKFLSLLDAMPWAKR